MGKDSNEIRKTPQETDDCIANDNSNDVNKLTFDLLHMSREEWQRLIQDKEHFRYNNTYHPNYCLQHYPPIARSWITSRGHGVNIKAQFLSRSFLDMRELIRIQQENEALIDYAKSLFSAFRREMQAYSHAYTLDLLDQNGIILYNNTSLSQGCPTIVPAAGTIWNDQIVGTNVCSLAFQIQHPVILPGILHYSDIFEDVTAVAAPIRNRSGRMVALLAYVQKMPLRPWEEGYQVMGLQSLGVVVAMAAAMENFIARSEIAKTGRKKMIPGPQPEIGRAGASESLRFSDLIGMSAEWRRAVSLGRRYAALGEHILLTGESGTGKELFARAIHNEHCPGGPFMAVNCAALPRSLIESELFGYEEGSFTGASRRGKPGKIELAHGGTFFLDEIGDMPLELQAVLLRVLEDKQVMRIGGRHYHKVDFRLIAATNKKLEQTVADGLFREDLYYRLSVLNIILPPLRLRGTDCELLARHFINKYSEKWGRAPLVLSPEACDLISSYSWPGNVRQLENSIVHALATEQSDVIQPGSLPEMVRTGQKLLSSEPPVQQFANQSDGDYSMASWEKAAIRAAIAASNNTIPLAAELLGIGTSTLYRKLREYGLK